MTDMLPPVLDVEADAQTPARQCHRCHSWVWLPNWWRHAQRCELREPANAELSGPGRRR